jgi:uncharacterized membrane protein
VHLRERPFVPLWFDIALLASYAGTGLLFAFSSMMDVHRVFDRLVGPTKAWVLIAATSFLSGFGIFVGRFLRWNSWDVLTDPIELSADLLPYLADPFDDPGPLAVTAIYGGLLLLGYASMRLFAVVLFAEEMSRKN